MKKLTIFIFLSLVCVAKEPCLCCDSILNGQLNDDLMIKKVVLNNQDLNIKGELHFKDGRYYGNIGCNNFFGAFKINASTRPLVIELSKIASTQMSCGDFDKTERLFLNAMGEELVIAGKQNRLYLFLSKNKALEIYVEKIKNINIK